MCKNVILNTAINTVLDLPRTGLWATAAVAVSLSLDAGLAIVGDTLELKAVGTTQVYAAPGELDNKNVANGIIDTGSIGGVTIQAGFSAVAITAAGPGERTIGGSGSDGEVVYASEVFRVTASPDVIPSGTLDYQAICYQIAGVIDKAFSVNFNITGASFAADDSTNGMNRNWAFGMNYGVNAAGANGTCAAGSPVGKYSASKMTLEVPPNSSCALGDGAQICLVYKLSSTSALKTPGTEVTISADVKVGSNTVGLAAPITVARSEQGAKFSLVSETDAPGEVFIASSSGNTEFTSTTGESDTSNTSDTEDWSTPFRGSNEVTIGTIKYSAGNAVGRDGSGAFSFDSTGTDTATLTIEYGQFAASLGGSSPGKVYLGTNVDATKVEDVSGTWTATWNLTGAHLADLTDSSPKFTAIIVRVDGLTKIDSGTDNDPLGTLDVKLGGTTSISDQPITSGLRRIPNDGKVCTAYNIPSPTGAADTLTLRITNDSDQMGTLTGTLYDQAGNEVGTNTDLLAGHIDYTKSPPVGRTTLGLADPLQLQPRETVILTSQNIATTFGETSW
jgi:hypothetical protein